MRLQGRHYFSLFWILFFAGIIYVSIGYTYKARLIPLVVSIPCLAFALYRFYVELTGKEVGAPVEEDLRLKEIMEKVGEISLGKKAREKVDKAEKKRRFIDILLWIAIFLALIFAAGFLVAFVIGTESYLYEGLLLPLIRQWLQS